MTTFKLDEEKYVIQRVKIKGAPTKLCALPLEVAANTTNEITSICRISTPLDFT